MKRPTPFPDFASAGDSSLPREGTAARISPLSPSPLRLLRDGCSRSGDEGDGAELLERARQSILADAAILPPIEDLGAHLAIAYLTAGELRILVSPRDAAGRVFWQRGARRALEALEALAAVEVPPGSIAIVALFLDGEKRAALAGSAPWPTKRD